MTDNGSNILVGWKDIATYLGVCVDTATSYEKDGLPVYRFRGRVRAVKTQIDTWVIGSEFNGIPDVKKG